jgi:hypothetical protein
MLSGILGGSGNTINNDYSFVIGQGITTACPNTTYVNCLSVVSIETNPVGCPSGTVYKDGSGFLKIV